MNMFVKQCQYIRFITLMIPIILVFVGMRVPDFSRPHKPKPMRRAVLDKSSARTIVQSVVKIDVDPVVTSPATLVFRTTEVFSPEAYPIHSLIPLLTLSSLPPRAPPAPTLLA